MYVVNIENGGKLTKDFVIKFFYKGYEISATPRDRINVYADETGDPIFMALEPDLLGIDACKEFVDGRQN